jgi:hypothetical protein
MTSIAIEIREEFGMAKSWKPGWLFDQPQTSPEFSSEPDCNLAKETNRDPVVTTWPPRPSELATWSASKRQQWGELANRLELEGVTFPESEQRAFEQLKTNDVTNDDNDNAW